MDLFIAGSETTTTTLNWGLLYMIFYPDIQGVHNIHRACICCNYLAITYLLLVVLGFFFQPSLQHSFEFSKF